MRNRKTSKGTGVLPQAADLPQPGPAASPALIEELAVANRILFDQGVLDAFGHVSVRHDQRPDRYLLARNMAPGSVTADDIIEFDLDSVPVNAQGHAVYLERFIHGEIYRVRPDVMAIVHSHSPSVVPFTVVRDNPLRAVCHMSGFLGGGTPIFEIRDVAGDETDLLIRDNALGVALAGSLGDKSVVLMRGHGSTVVAETLHLAVFRAVYTEVNARTQAEAMRLGTVTFLSSGEAKTTSESIGTQIRRAWDFWKKKACAAER